MLGAAVEDVVADLVQFDEAAVADWLTTCTDDQLVRVCSVAEWLMYHGPGTPSGGMPIARALCLAAVYVCEGAPRDLARQRRRRLPAPREHVRPDGSYDLGRRPDHAAATRAPFAYGVGDDARAFWTPQA